MQPTSVRAVITGGVSGLGLAVARRLVADGGKVALLGIPSGDVRIDWNDVIFKMLTIKGIYGREMFETWHKMIAMVQSGLDLKPIITHHFSVDDYQKAFETMATGQSGKVILEWDK